MILNLLIFAIATAALVRSSTFLVESLTRIAVKLHLSEFLVGFVLMAIATSLPELMIGIISALEGDPLLSLGNVIGSNIADLSIIIGLPVLLVGGIAFQNTFRKEELLFMNLSAIAPLILLLDGSLNRLEGAILLIFFVFYMYELIFHSKAYRRVIQDHKEGRSLGLELFFFATGLAVLLISATALVSSGESLATAIGIPTILIGIVIIALGTSLPELAFSFASAKTNPDLFFGDVMGSVVANATLVLGLTAIISPIQLNGSTGIFVLSELTLLIVLAFFSVLLGRGKFTVKSSLVLVLGYVIFAILEAFFGTLK